MPNLPSNDEITRFDGIYIGVVGSGFFVKKMYKYELKRFIFDVKMADF
jgi:hypothetical protein